MELCAPPRATRLIRSLILFPRMSLYPETVVLVVREMAVNADDFHSPVDVGGAHVADGAGHVEHELAHAHGIGQGFGRDEDFAGEQALQEVPTEVTLTHVVNRPEHSFPFGLSWLQHDERDAPPVRPMA